MNNGLQMTYWILSCLGILTVLIPLIKSNYWTFRVFDYVRGQKFIYIIITTIAWFFIVKNPTTLEYALLITQILALIFLAYVIIPYTILGQKMIKKTTLRPKEKPLSLLVCNVYQDNKKYQKLLNLIKTKQPDIVFLLETDEYWRTNLLPATKDYPYKIEVPLDNTYGLLFYSKYALLDQEVNYLIDTEIPSITTTIDYHGKAVRLYGIHPTPPVPQENTESTERDAEILMVGEFAEQYAKPAIVFGDLNDVAWSHTTKLFLKSSGLLDPRRGRGMYNTFHAKHWFLRWPLDHFFVSAHFRLIEMKVEDHVDSDHFPISISLVIRSEDDSQQLEISEEEEAEVEEKIEEGIEKGDAN